MAAGKPAWYEPGPGGVDLDAMGNDKRRRVIGQRYGTSPRKRLLVYGIAVAVVVLVVIAVATVIRNVDGRQIPLEDKAPWAADNAPRVAPSDVDFRNNGPTDSIAPDQVLNR